MFIVTVSGECHDTLSLNGEVFSPSDMTIIRSDDWGRFRHMIAPAPTLVAPIWATSAATI